MPTISIASTLSSTIEIAVSRLFGTVVLFRMKQKVSTLSFQIWFLLMKSPAERSHRKSENISKAAQEGPERKVAPQHDTSFNDNRPASRGSSIMRKLNTASSKTDIGSTVQLAIAPLNIPSINTNAHTSREDAQEEINKIHSVLGPYSRGNFEGDKIQKTRQGHVQELTNTMNQLITFRQNNQAHEEAANEANELIFQIRKWIRNPVPDSSSDDDTDAQAE